MNESIARRNEHLSMSGNLEKTRLIIAGGGTGGHVFPGIAIAEAVEDRTGLELLWIGTGRQVETAALRGRAWNYKCLNVRPLHGVGLGKRAISLLSMPLVIMRALAWIREFKPDIVLGVGGYVSGPVLVAARLLGIPTAIHEQNLVPGLANRLSARFAGKVLVSFEETRKYFPKNIVELTGTPVRKSILMDRDRHNFRGDGHKRLLVIGGSQGSQSLNRLASSAIKILWQSGIKIEVWHQTGTADCSRVRDAYQEVGLPAKVSPFINEMGRAYRWADLVLCRAGATTLSELTSLGVASILIPYPFASDGHQEANAKLMERAGAAKCFRQDDIGAVKLAGEIEMLFRETNRLNKMREKAERLGRPNATRDIVSILLKNKKGNRPKGPCTDSTIERVTVHDNV